VRFVVAFLASAALHASLVLALLRPGSASTGEQERQVVAVFVPPMEDPVHPGLKPSTERESSVGLTERTRTVAFGGFRLDLRKVADRSHLLFPILTPGLAIDRFFPRSQALAVPRLGVGRPQIKSDGQSGRMLQLSDRALQQIVDRSWARRERWRAFQAIKKLVETHTSGGSLPRVLREYRAQNALQPYTDQDARDPRLWTQLALAADHVEFIAFIRRYVSSHPSTEASSELLFLLDTIVQANRDALRVLLDSDPATDLQLTARSNHQAYSLIVELRAEYADTLKRRGLASGAEIDTLYDEARLAILTQLLASTPDGYGADDARFLIGAIYWHGGRRADAVRKWSELGENQDGVYANASTALRAIVNSTHLDAREIERVLANENGRWLSFSYDRLRRFGYAFDRY
jgi:hypothetical protein